MSQRCLNERRWQRDRSDRPPAGCRGPRSLMLPVAFAVCWARGHHLAGDNSKAFARIAGARSSIVAFSASSEVLAADRLDKLDDGRRCARCHCARRPGCGRSASVRARSATVLSGGPVWRYPLSLVERAIRSDNSRAEPERATASASWRADVAAAAALSPQRVGRISPAIPRPPRSSGGDADFLPGVMKGADDLVDSAAKTVHE